MNAETYVESVVIDICSRSFFITSNENDERVVECDSAEEFMNVLEVCTLVSPQFPIVPLRFDWSTLKIH